MFQPQWNYTGIIVHLLTLVMTVISNEKTNLCDIAITFLSLRVILNFLEFVSVYLEMRNCASLRSRKQLFSM